MIHALGLFSGRPRSRWGRLLLAGGGTAFAALVFLLAQPTHAADYRVLVDGRPVRFTGTGPVNVSGRVMVPLRDVLECAGARVRSATDEKTGAKTMTAGRGRTTMQLQIGQADAVINGKPVHLDVPPMMMRGTVMVPLRLIVETLGATVEQSKGQIRISTVPRAPKRTGATVAMASKPRVTPPARPANVAPSAAPTAPTKPVAAPSAPTKPAASPAPAHPAPAAAPREASPRPNPQTLSGIIEAVNADGNPQTLTVLVEGKSTQYPLAPSAVVLTREGETGIANESTLKDVCAGDKVMAKMDSTGKITILVAQYEQVEGEVAAAAKDSLELKGAGSVTLNEATRVTAAGGADGSRDDLRTGDTVRVRLRVGTREAALVAVLKPSPNPPAAEGGAAPPAPGAPAPETGQAALAPAATGENQPAAPATGENQPAATGNPPAAPANENQPATGAMQPSAAANENQPAATGAAQPGTAADAGLKVASFTHDAKTPLRAGTILNVTLEGDAGAQATFDVDKVAAGLAMQETAPGKYVGSYTVADGLNTRVSVFARLEREGKASPLVQAGVPVLLDAIAPTASDMEPARDAVVQDPQPVIYAVFADEAGSGVDAENVRLIVAGEDVTTQATRTGRFITYRPIHPFANGPVAVKVAVPDRAGNVASVEWRFAVNAPEVAITSITHNATRAVDQGHTFTVTMAGKPGGKATFDIGTMKIGIPMAETAPGSGIYQARYEAEKGDLALSVRVVGHLALDTGEQFVRECSEPITIVTVPPKAPVITSPAEGDLLEGSAIVTGKAQPGVIVRVQVVRKVRTLGLWSDTDVMAMHEVKVENDGSFTTIKVQLPHQKKAEMVTIQAVAVDPAGHRSPVTAVKAKIK